MDGHLPLPPHGSYENWVDQVPATPSRGGRPVAVTTAGVLMLVSAGFSFLGGVILLSSRGQVGDRFGAVSAPVRLVAVAVLLVGAFNLLAGLLVLARSYAGRVVAMVLAGLGVLAAIAQLSRVPSTGLVSIAINVSILFALGTNGSAFVR
jgi:hypothetical protein